jgi:7,8-dihydro-6-hydroxymethylpterin-pyrophosphokinase
MKPSIMHRFTLLLASNEDPHTHMAKAKASLDAYFNDTLIWSRIHESSPYGVMSPDALPYLNAVCQGRTSQDLEAFIGWLKALETQHGAQAGCSRQGSRHTWILTW